MRTVELKLKQASAVLGVVPKDLQNLVQFKVIRPLRRNGVYWFDRNLLLQAKAAFYLKKSLGSSTDLLGKFIAALSGYLNRSSLKNLTDVSLSSRPVVDGDAIEIKIPLRSLARELEKALAKTLIPDALRKGRARPGWKEDFLNVMHEVAVQMGDISEEEVIRTIEEYRAEVKQKKLQALRRLGKAKPASSANLPEVSLIVPSKRKTA